MRQDSGRVVLFTAAAGMAGVHAVRLSWSLFLEYMSSPTFGGDVADTLCNYEGLAGFFTSGFNPSVLAETYARVLGHRLIYRFTECAVSAACAFSPLPFFQGAVVFHYLYPTVQEYRFGRCWLTRLLRCLSSWVIPRVFRPAPIDPQVDPDGAYLQNPPPPMAAAAEATTTAAANAYRNPLKGDSKAESAVRKAAAVGAGSISHSGRGSSSSSSSSTGASKKAEREAAYYTREEAVFNAMPDVCAATLRYYVYSYKSAPLRTVLQAGFIPDVARLLVDLGQWGVIIAEERKKKTSRWRIWKRFFADQASTLVQVALSYSVRYVSAVLALWWSREPTGGAVFWTESMVHLACAVQILSISAVVRVLTYEYLDKRFSATSEDYEEDLRERAEREEAAAQSDAWARMATDGLNGSATGNDTAQGKGDGATSGGRFIDFYTVLDISEGSSQAEIRRAYRQLALKNHPDRVGRDAEEQRTARERMAVINEAYDTLTDARKRSQYDAQRRAATAAPNFVDKLEKMSALRLAGLTVGLASLAGVAGYAHFVAAFQRVTASGYGPLMLFSGVAVV